MSSPLRLRDQRLSIVIPNARTLPQALIESLVSQTSEGDEILIVRNRPLSGSRHWAGIGLVGASPFATRTNPEGRPEAVNSRLVRSLEADSVRILCGTDEGAAAARNRGWRAAKNDSVLFIDDDVTVGETFLSDIRQYVASSPVAGVATFRILSSSGDVGSPFVEATVSLDRGAEVRRTGLIPLRLQDAWMFGAGAAMLASRNALMTTGGFKNELGAGRRNGGTEDSEFLWHASRHTMIEYCGHITVLHEGVANLSILGRKMREYGRAIGHLGGMSRSVDGSRYVTNYCSHILKSAFRSDVPLSRRSVIHVRALVLVAVLETLFAYISSLARPSSCVLCEECRGGAL